MVLLELSISLRSLADLYWGHCCDILYQKKAWRVPKFSKPMALSDWSKDYATDDVSASQFELPIRGSVRTETDRCIVQP